MRPSEPEKAPSVAPVTVVVPCYNCAETIDRAVASVVGQSWPPAELILVDDGNSEVTRSALRVQQQRLGDAFVRIISFPQNRGVAAARNAGWDATTQPYVAFLDSDDAWHPRKLELHLRFMLEHPDVEVCAHGLRWVVGDVPVLDVARTMRVKDIEKWELLLYNPIVMSSVILRRALSLRFNPERRRSEDYGLWLEAISSGVRITLLDAQLAYSYKAPFGADGLSGALWKAERGELGNYLWLRKRGHISLGTWLAVSAFSLAKYARRLLIVSFKRSHSRADS